VFGKCGDEAVAHLLLADLDVPDDPPVDPVGRGRAAHAERQREQHGAARREVEMIQAGPGQQDRAVVGIQSAPDFSGERGHAGCGVFQRRAQPGFVLVRHETGWIEVRAVVIGQNRQRVRDFRLLERWRGEFTSTETQVLNVLQHMPHPKKWIV
jgi:hypothetical protein